MFVTPTITIPTQRCPDFTPRNPPIPSSADALLTNPKQKLLLNGIYTGVCSYKFHFSLPIVYIHRSFGIDGQGLSYLISHRGVQVHLTWLLK
jgi:hypothetical protein